MSGPSPATVAVRAGIDTDTAFGAVVPPMVLSTNFSFAGFDQKRQYDYTRSGNPTRDLLAEALADLEGGVGGVVTATGMAAITLVLALLEPGDTLVVPHDCYGGSWRLFNALAKKNHFRLITTDLTDPRALAAALAREPAPGLDRDAVEPAAAHHRHPLRRRSRASRSARWSSSTTPSCRRRCRRRSRWAPTSCVHSTTKYINGHSDVVGGAVVAQRRPSCTSSWSGGRTRWA